MEEQPMAGPEDNKTGVQAKSTGQDAGAPAPTTPAPPAATIRSTPLDSAADAVANMVDTSVNRRLGPFRRLLKSLVDSIRGTDTKVDALRKEVDDLKARPTPDPLGGLAAVFNRAGQKLEILDQKSIQETERMLSPPPATEKA